MGKGTAWRHMVCALLPLLAVAGAAQAQNYGYGGGYNDRYRDPYSNGGGDGIVRCESVRNRSNECRLEGRPRLIRQLSGSPCVEGDSWGQSRYGVWVTNGCRAEFVGESRRPQWGGGGGGWGGNGGGWGGGQIIACDSNSGRQRRCNVTIRRDARLVRQNSNTPCIEGQTWGWDRGGVWVDGGCRGQFQIN